MRIFIQRKSNYSTYVDYRIHMNTFGHIRFATDYPIDEAVIVAGMISDDRYTARAVFEDGTPVTETDIRSLYTGMGNVETIVHSLYKN